MHRCRGASTSGRAGVRRHQRRRHSQLQITHVNGPSKVASAMRHHARPMPISAGGYYPCPDQNTHRALPSHLATAAAMNSVERLRRLATSPTHWRTALLRLLGPLASPKTLCSIAVIQIRRFVLLFVAHAACLSMKESALPTPLTVAIRSSGALRSPSATCASFRGWPKAIRVPHAARELESNRNERL